MDKRYQVFVSSTYIDLREERQEVMQALLELDCIPTGMELFPAADEDQWSLISKIIDECDYYIVIIAGRYGSIGPDGLGYTEKEYQYALEKGIPIIAFLHSDLESLKASRTEKKEEMQEKLKAFRDLAQQKMCKYWTSPQELGSVVSRSLIKLIKSKPAIGWVRADNLPSADLLTENLELRGKVENLRSKLNTSATEPPKGTETLSQGLDLAPVKIELNYGEKKYNAKGFYHDVKLSWNDIFSTISPLMIDEATEASLKAKLDSYMQKRFLEEVRELMNGKGDFFKFELATESFDTIKIQLRALNIITQSTKVKSVKDLQTYWSLTPYGDTLMIKLRAIKRQPLETPQ